MIGKVDCVVAGAGCLGLSVARALSFTNRLDVLVMESLSSIGQGISSRNSEVVHGGLYYPNNSLKASLCVKGRRMLYDYLTNHNIPFMKCGKVVVATSEQECIGLNRIYEHGLRNGVEDLRFLSEQETRELEPNVFCKRSLWSPQTGIFDSHCLMQNLQNDAESSGTSTVFNCSIIEVKTNMKGLLVCTNQGDVLCDVLVNAAGLHSQALAACVDGFPKNKIPYAFYSKGNYFKLKGSSPFSRLVYPLPSDGGLGVHATLDLSGATRFGPDTEWLMSKDSSRLRPSKSSPATNAYNDAPLALSSALAADPNLPFAHSSPPSGHDVYCVDEGRAQQFYAAIQKYWPDIPPNALEADYAGIRPKLIGPFPHCTTLVESRLGSQSPSDFMLQGPRSHGLRGLYNFFGVESPGLTSCLALAELLSEQIRADSI